ncbi:MAG: hypothetical protein ACI95T_001164 [Flavobacteriales bacterium]|jgi:hypothetical protein
MFRFLIYSNIWISIGSALLTYLVYIINDTNPNYNYVGFVFFSTLFSYLLQRLVRIKKIAKTSPNSWVVLNKKTAISLLIVSFIGAVFCFSRFYSTNPFILYWILILGIVSTGYSVADFRDLPYFKIIMIASSWGIACGVIHLILIESYELNTAILNFGWVFCYILAITIPFDIRDLGIDEERKKTIPQWVGIKNSKIIALLFLLFSILIFGFLSSPLQLMAYIISSFFSGYLIYNSNKNRSDIYFTFLIDGHIIFQFLLIFFLS